jgi:hypothetical protein
MQPYAMGLNTYVVRPYSINFLNFIAESHSFVDDELQEVVWRRLPSQESKLFIDSVTPSNDDSSANL